MDETLKEESPLGQEYLARLLIEGHMTADAFIEELFNLDQSTMSRDDALKNVEVIERPDIKEILSINCDPDRFNNFYSFTHFHVFQILAHAQNMPKALEHLKISNGYSSKITEDKNWPIYVRATLAYCENKPNELKDLYNLMNEYNKAVVERLINGLENRGHPVYNEDY